MAKRSINGICHICGNRRVLSFEHVPPRQAFNDRRLSVITGRNCIDTNINNLRDTSGEIRQKGLGSYTLCVKCNNDTGAWYGPAYIEWTRQGMGLTERTIKNHTQVTFRIHPLRVIKQIICIFLSTMKTTDLQVFRNELAKFVLNKNERNMNSSIHIFTYLNPAPIFRSSAVSFKLDIKKGKHYFFCDFVFPPYGYILSDRGDFDSRLIDISDFSQYCYEDLTDISIPIPIYPIETWIPGALNKS